LASGEHLRLGREARAVSVQEIAAFFKKGGATESIIYSIEAMPKVPRETESRYFAALLTVVLFRARRIAVHSCPKLSPAADIENPKIDQESGR
jgi:hypothetical protein